MLAITYSNDHDYIIRATDADPLTPVYDQGEWGATPAEYCTRNPSARRVTQIAFPRNATFTAFGENNAFVSTQVSILGSTSAGMYC